MSTLQEQLDRVIQRQGENSPLVQMLRNQIMAEQSGKNFRELYYDLTELEEPVDPSIKETSAEDVPQPNSILYEKNVKTSSINDQSKHLVGDIMNSQEKNLLLAAKQSPGHRTILMLYIKRY